MASRVCRTARSAWNDVWSAGAATAASLLASTGCEMRSGIPIAIDRPEILWRASGLGRAGLVAQMTAPRLATRLAIGIETPLAHAIVDRLLGFDRSFAESRLQLTPVEWGVWTFLFLRALEFVRRRTRAEFSTERGHRCHLSPGDLTLDRVGPDPFDPSGLGSIVTVRWPVRIGDVAGAARLWLPESVVSLWLARPTVPASTATPLRPAHRNDVDPAGESFRRVPARRARQLVARRGGVGDHVSGAEAAANGGRLAASRFAG